MLGAFNPGLTRLPNGNLLMMVRVAEALNEPVRDGRSARSAGRRTAIVLDAWPCAEVDMTDPRQFSLEAAAASRMLGLTSLSWLLPVELTPDGREVVAVHYDRAIAPARRLPGVRRRGSRASA